MGETVLADKIRFGAKDALAMAKKAKRVLAARGKRVVALDRTATEEELLAVLLGPTGNLRAPTAWVGDTLMVGFNPEVYKQVLAAG